uniref:Putative ovule protein n=1 Tax=Solanum chacoense TaxID=4108 RepID=A0A0V0H9V8_SOLCH
MRVSKLKYFQLSNILPNFCTNLFCWFRIKFKDDHLMKRGELRKIGVDLKEEQHIKFVDHYVRGQKLEGNC